MKAKKTIEHYPHFGIMLDLDAYIDDPPYPEDLSISDFITNAFSDYDQIKKIVLTAIPKNR